jgi:hypothetical protein
MGLEVTAVADPNAVGGIQKFIYKKTSSDPWLGKALVDQGTGLLGQIIGINQNDTTVKKSYQTKVDSWTRECIKNAEHKLYSNLFTCQIKIYSNTIRNTLSIKSVLPTAINKFKVFKTHKPQNLPPKLQKPTRHHIQNNILCNLWWTIPLMTLLFTGVLGWFNPLKILTSITPTNLAVPISAMGLAVCLFAAFKKRQPIVLSTLELAQIVGLPSAIEKLPIALGKVPTTRTQLGTQQQQTVKEKQKTKPTPTTITQDTAPIRKHSPQQSNPYQKLLNKKDD